MIKRIINALPGVDNGDFVFDLGRLGTVALTVGKIHIGQDVVTLPLRFHLRRNSDSGGVEMPLSLTNWQICDDAVWFTLEQAVIFREPLSRVAQGVLHVIVGRVLQRNHGDRVRLLRRGDQLGIPVMAFMSRWGDPQLPVEITGIEVKNGVVLYLD